MITKLSMLSHGIKCYKTYLDSYHIWMHYLWSHIYLAMINMLAHNPWSCLSVSTCSCHSHINCHVIIRDRLCYMKDPLYVLDRTDAVKYGLAINLFHSGCKLFHRNETNISLDNAFHLCINISPEGMISLVQISHVCVLLYDECYQTIPLHN